MKNEDHFPTDQLIRNTISAFKNGYIGEEQALSTIDSAVWIFAFDFEAIFDADMFNKLYQCIRGI